MFGEEVFNGLQGCSEIAEVFNGERKDNTVADIGKLCQAPEAIGTSNKKSSRHFTFAICGRVTAFRRQLSQPPPEADAPRAQKADPPRAEAEGR